MTFLALCLMAIGLVMLKSIMRTKTAYFLTLVLIVIMPLIIAFGSIGIIGGIVITIVATFAIIAIDEAGILA